MKRKPKIVEVPYMGQISCGKPVVVPFPTNGKFRQIVVPPGVKSAALCTFEACGSSLTGERIEDGDLLIVRTVFEKGEINGSTICVVHIVPTGEVTAKKLKFNQNSTITLRSTSGESDAVYDETDIEIQGIIIGFQSMFR